LKCLIDEFIREIDGDCIRGNKPCADLGTIHIEDDFFYADIVTGIGFQFEDCPHLCRPWQIQGNFRQGINGDDRHLDKNIGAMAEFESQGTWI